MAYTLRLDEAERREAEWRVASLGVQRDEDHPLERDLDRIERHGPAAMFRAQFDWAVEDPTVDDAEEDAQLALARQHAAELRLLQGGMSDTGGGE